MLIDTNELPDKKMIFKTSSITQLHIQNQFFKSMDIDIKVFCKKGLLNWDTKKPVKGSWQIVSIPQGKHSGYFKYGLDECSINVIRKKDSHLDPEKVQVKCFSMAMDLKNIEFEVHVNPKIKSRWE